MFLVDSMKFKRRPGVAGSFKEFMCVLGDVRGFHERSSVSRGFKGFPRVLESLKRFKPLLETHETSLKPP